MSLGEVLVVGDEPKVRQVLQDFLSDRGYDVLLAESGSAALAALRAHKDGIEILKRIAALEPSVPVIMMSGNEDIGVTSKLLAMGAVDYIPKPFDLDYLDHAVSVQVAAAQDR